MADEKNTGGARQGQDEPNVDRNKEKQQPNQGTKQNDPSQQRRSPDADREQQENERKRA
jgi:hypothetical protein